MQPETWNFLDILVHIPTVRPLRPVIDASISLGRAFGAHIDATAIGYKSTGTAVVMDGSAAAIVAAVFEMAQKRAARSQARRSCAEGYQAISFAGGHSGKDFDQWSTGGPCRCFETARYATPFPISS
jgi:hypothetical protein